MWSKLSELIETIKVTIENNEAFEKQLSDLNEMKERARQNSQQAAHRAYEEMMLN